MDLPFCHVAMLQANAASNNFLVNHTVVNMPNGAMGGSSLPPYNQPAPYPSGYYPTPPNHSTSQTVYSPPPLPATSHDPELAPPPPSYQDYTKDTRI
ncbi:uncharacterized protein BYT42DRAFT_583792 [Radiomyces spectabilis]|uniref:uncharacterized protein n=1 Tax=Radiomyces spectabilis TaxID=64574 RepID=UPI00221F8F9B|nr:uncharacterized protein BYT42DRAFT_583792 [Radiomyces spectabilis]KAI8369283.1 hypothetical protein BYT42DRAFT_583792 [Radiomyces spectabilis]